MKSYIKVLNIFFLGGFSFLRLRKYLRSYYLQDISFPESLQDDYNYHSQFYNRAKQYIHANHFFGEFLCLTRGRKLQVREMKRFICLSSCAPVFDDFFEQQKDSESLKRLMHQPIIENAQTDAEKLAALFFSQILEDLSDSTKLLEAADCLFDAQVKSKTQTNNKADSSKLLQISLEKGGYSGLMYGLLLEKKSNDDLLKLAFDLGSYGQLMDDVFDLYDDAEQGIRTFANQASSVQEIRMLVEEQEQKILDLLRNIFLDWRYRRRFEEVLIVFSSIIELALIKYEQNEKNENKSPKDCLELPRASWILDMEKGISIWRLFSLSAQRM